MTGGNSAIAVVTADQRHIEPKGPGKTSFKVLVRNKTSVWSAFSVTVKSRVQVQSIQADDMDFSILNPLEPRTKTPEIDWSPSDATDKGYVLASCDTLDGGHRTTFNVVVSSLDFENRGLFSRFRFVDFPGCSIVSWKIPCPCECSLPPCSRSSSSPPSSKPSSITEERGKRGKPSLLPPFPGCGWKTRIGSPAVDGCALIGIGPVSRSPS